MEIDLYETIAEYIISLTEEEFIAIIERDRRLLEEENFGSMLTTLAFTVPDIYGTLMYHETSGPYIWFKLRKTIGALDTTAISLEQIQYIINLYINEPQDLKANV
jgi:hypothetical protein